MENISFLITKKKQKKTITKKTKAKRRGDSD